MDLSVIGIGVMLLVLLVSAASNAATIWKATRPSPSHDEKYALAKEMQTFREDVMRNFGTIEVRIDDVSRVRETSNAGLHKRMNDLGEGLRELIGEFRATRTHTDQLLTAVGKVNKVEGKLEEMQRRSHDG